VFWEVKGLRGTVSRMQAREHREIQKHGGNVIVTYGLWDAFEYLDVVFP
jgi:hypothetical protein